jgi:RHS repeat-associated protein
MKSRILQLFVLIFTVVICRAQDDLPANYSDGWYVETNATIFDPISAFPLLGGGNPPVTDGMTAIAEAITPDISALAENLLKDPARIFNYVHDHIRYVHYFGSHKGAEITLLERSGNDFDQCALLVALLRAAGYSPTYQFGMVAFPYTNAAHLDFQHWVGATMPNTNFGAVRTLASTINGNAGYPYTTTLGGDTNDLLFHHVWVQLTNDGAGANYVLDPAFKTGIAINGVNLDSAAQINTNTLVSDAGGTATTDYVQNLSESSIRSDLSAYTANLRTYIQNNMPNASVQQIIGGQTTIPSVGLSQPVAFTIETGNGEWPVSQWQYIPTNLMAVFMVVIPGSPNVTNSFYVPGLQGARLSLACTSSGQVQLSKEDDAPLASVQQTGSSPTFRPTLTFQHPFGTWAFTNSNGLVRSGRSDQTVNSGVYQKTNATYILLYGFDANAAWLTARQRQLDLYRQQGYVDSSSQVTRETLNVMGLSWLTETELVDELLSSQSFVLNHCLHRFGRMGLEAGAGYYIDVAGQTAAITPFNTTNASGTFNLYQKFQTSGYLDSALEHGIIEQLQNTGLTAASTVKMLQLANSNSLKIYLATTNNWTSGANVSGNISGYGSGSGSTFNAIAAAVQSGEYVLLPQSGAIQLAGSGSWTGNGFVIYRKAPGGAESQGMEIGGLYGGYVSSSSAVPSAPTIAGLNWSQTSFFNPQSATLSVGKQYGADPVSLVDGSFQIMAEDLTLGSTEPRGLNLRRFYSSARRNVNLAGMSPGWLHSYYCKATTDSGWQAGLEGATTPQQMAPILVATRAALDIYNSSQPDPKGWMMTALIAKWGIDQLINNAVSVTLGNDTVQFVKQPDGTYTPQANCTMSLSQVSGAYWLTERHGRTFKFSVSGLLTNIVDPYGQALNVTYNASNWVQGVTDWKGHSLTFNYTGTPSRLTSVSDNAGRSVSYGYTGGDLTSFTDAEGKTTSYVYDTNHQAIATLDALSRVVVTNSYDSGGHVTTQMSAGDTNKLWKIFASGYNTVEIDPRGGARQFAYDDKSRMTAFQDALGNLTQYLYDGQDHVVETISPMNEANFSIYDGNNNLIETIDPLGYSNVLTYDGNNNVATSTDGRGNTGHFGYNAQFGITGSTNGNGDWKAFNFNSDGTLQYSQDAGGQTTYGYDSSSGYLNLITYPSSLGTIYLTNNALGDVIGRLDPRGFGVSYAYNKRRELTVTIAPTNVMAQVGYDPNDNVLTMTNARGYITSNNWSVTRHLLSTAFPTMTQGTPTIYRGYDSRDWLVNAQNPLGKYTYFTNDAANRLVAMTDPLQRATRFVLDGDGRQTTTTNAASEATTQFFDARGNAFKIIDGANDTTGKTYDGAGNLIYLTNRNGKVWTFQYDGANRLTNTTSPLGKKSIQVYNNRGLLQISTDPKNQTTTFTFDACARTTSRTDSMGTITNQYDGDNNLTVVSNAGTGIALSWVYDAYDRPSSFTDAFGHLIQYRYDANGNLTNLIYPGNRIVKYFYDSNNRLTNVTDWASRQTVFSYDLAGRLTGLTRPNNTARTMGYDDDGELTSIVDQTATKFPIAFNTLHYNLAGRTDWEFKGPPSHGFTPPSRTITYDDDNRLNTFNSTSVTMDDDGNMTYGPLTNNIFGSYVYDVRNELTSAGGVTYSYDGAGNRISLTNGAGVATFIINPQDSQTLIRMKAATTNYYVYGKGLLYEVDETATTTNTIFYHFDCRGSTGALTDASGNLTDLVEYSPYGTTAYRAGTTDTPFLFNGQFGVQTDPNGLLYMRVRYFNPNISRFLNPDPSGFNGGLNLYAFCNDNPISLIDPFGLDPAFSPGIGIFSSLNASQEIQACHAVAPFVGGALVGAAGAGVVVLAAPVAVSGLTAFGLSQTAAAAAVTVGVGISAVIGTSQIAGDLAGNWSQNGNQVAYDAGLLTGGFALGSIGAGRALGQGISGKLSSLRLSMNPFADTDLGYDPNFPGGSLLTWLATAPTPSSGGAVIGLTSAGTASFIQQFRSSSTGK